MGLAINDSSVLLSDAEQSPRAGRPLDAAHTGDQLHHGGETAAPNPSRGEFWPPMTIVIAGGAVRPTSLALGFTQAMLTLIGPGRGRSATTGNAAPQASRPIEISSETTPCGEIDREPG